MTEDLNKMETEIDAMLASLSGKLTVGPNPQATQHVKSEIRHQLNETWLADQPVPTPSAATLKRVQETINHELKKTTPRPWLRPRIWGPLAAAASIAIFAVLTNYIATTQIHHTPTVDMDIFVQALEETFEETPFALAADMDLNDIEDSINNLTTSTNYEDEIIDDIGNEIDELFNQPDWLENIDTGAIG